MAMRAWLAALVATSLLVVAGACSGQTGSNPGVCAPAARTTLLKVLLDRWVPTPPFTVAANVTVWGTVTTLPVTAGGIFGDVGPVADIHPILNGTAPAVTVKPNGDKRSSDPVISLYRGPGWQQLPIRPGTWQVYSETNPEIMVVACPKSG